MGKEVVRVIVKAESGFFVEPSDAYTERLQLDRQSVSYERKPRLESEHNPLRRWSYRTDNPSYGLIFDEVASTVADALNGHRDYVCCDAGPITLSVTYGDRTRESRTFFEPAEAFEGMFGLIRIAIPPLEDMPALLG